MAHVYILYSKTADRYYTGSCKNLSERLKAHASKEYNDSYTAAIGNDWELFFEAGGLEYEQARKIELHIKQMKSRKYIENLERYPKMMEKLAERYK